MKNSQKGFTQPLVISIIILSLVIGGGWYLVYKNKKTKVPEAPMVLDNGKYKTSSQVDTSNWKTYTNARYGFSIKYPKDTEVKDTSLGVILTNKEKVFTVNVLQGLPADEFACGFEAGSRGHSDISLDGVVFTSFDLSKQTQDYGGGNVSVTEYCAFYKGNKYELFPQINFPSSSEYVKDSSLVDKDILLNQILSTFKFTK